MRARRIDASTAEAVGRAVVLAEHTHFVEQGVDNHEHIPRLQRIAAAVATSLAETGREQEAASVRSALLNYGRRLFLDEWLAQLQEGEDRETVRQEGEDEFERIVRENDTG